MSKSPQDNPAAPDMTPIVIEPNKDRIVVIAPLENTLKAYRGGRLTPATPIPYLVVVRSEGPFVVLILNEKACQFTTTQAHDTGCGIGYLMAECAPNEYIILEVNGEQYNLPHRYAEKLVKGFLRRADHVDDFQLKNRVRILQ